MKKVIVGIDPDLRESGYCITVDGLIHSMQKLSFPKLIDAVCMLETECGSAEYEFSVRLEDIEANKPMFVRNLQGAKQAMKVAQDVGKVKGVARMINEMLEHNGITAEMIKPLKGTIKKAKKDASYFNQITGWDKRSNEDGRDAALLALHDNVNVMARCRGIKV